jgi:acetyl-CoA/propionyl-CoA carboxylase biotin carboxyl carrier protein
VSEETTGLDLVREQFRIAAGERLRITEDPEPRGHSIEFRINGEDPGRGFLPAPGTVTAWVPPTGPGVRVDAGVEAGSVVGGNFDSLLAKVIVTGSDRDEALARARRALGEMVVDGMATALPFHRAVLDDAAFTSSPFSVHTRWIETEFDNQIPPFAGAASSAESEPREVVVVEVGGKRLEVSLPSGFGPASAPASGGSAARGRAPKRGGGAKSGAAASGDAVVSPMQGTIVKIAVEDGQEVAEGELIVVLEAMKMEQPLNAHKAGTVTSLSAVVGEVVPAGTQICQIKD